MLQSQEFKIGTARPRKVKVDVIGHIKGCETDIKMELQNEIPARCPNNDEAALLIEQEISRIGGLSIKVDNETYEFYSLSLFSSITLKFYNIETVQLI